jgi:hypothetical protein
MKLHSDNVRVTAGRVPLQNLNVFVDPRLAEPTLANLRRVAARVEEMGRLALRLEAAEDTPPGKTSLPVLSIPLLRPLGPSYPGEYRVLTPLLWGDLLLDGDQPAALCSTGADDRHAARGRGVRAATAVPATFQTTEYDDYEGASLQGVPDVALRELGIDRALLDLPAGPEELRRLKTMSVYAPSLTPATRGAAVAVELRDEPEEGFCRSSVEEYLAERPNALYDEFWVEFVRKDQPFAYVAVEAQLGGVREAGAFELLFPAAPAPSRAEVLTALACWREIAAGSGS